jgi:cell surface protein SprA
MGMVIFPSRTPFDSDTTFSYDGGSQSAPLADRVPTLYNYTSEAEQISQSKYYLQVRTSSVYEYYHPWENLIVIPGLMRRGSVRIYRSGYPLTEFVDFVVDYANSQIKLISSRARDDSRELMVIYDRGVRPS